MARQNSRQHVSHLTQLRYGAETWVVRSAIAGIRLMSPDVSSAVIGKLVAAVGPFLGRSKQAHRNLQRIFPDMTRGERKRLVRKMWENAGRVAGEYPHLERLLAEPERITLVGLEDVQEALKGHKSALLLSAHFGNWEMTMAAGRAVGLSQANVYRPVKNPGLDALLVDLRHGLVPGGLIAKGEGNMRQIIRTLRNGVSVGILVDQREARGIRIPFLGVDAMTLHGPALIARRANVPIFVGVARRLSGARFVVECKHVPVPVTDDAEADAHAATQAINDILSDWIREAPEQWLWFHNRWRISSQETPSTD